MAQTSESCREPIAVVGSGCRFPGNANSASSLWKLLEKPRDLCREIPLDRFSQTGFYHQDGARHGTTNVRHSYFLDEDVRVFDAAFFNISPSEAEAMDPQQRLLLETVYEALEAGGHTLEGLRGSDTSVYVGTMTVDYLDTLLRDNETIPKYFATGINRAIISNRVSYFFDWHGPSMTIDTACSSSLVAVHQGVQSLRSGESRVSLACGTQALLGYDMYIGESKLKMLSPQGRSRMWDADADGYARGEGVAAIVMKRLSDAIADGDHIECIVRETGANQDGFSNGLTVPSTEAQAALIRQTYTKAGLDPVNRPSDRPQYFEAHGTGTQAGDPREAAAIHDAFGQYNHAEGADPLYVGSIKTVVGHLEGAAGLAGLLKASSSLQKGMIPPNLSFSRLNPKIEPFYKGLHVPTAPIPWPALPEGCPRRVSVNSFGFGGANAHAILEQYLPDAHHLQPQSQDSNQSGPIAPFVFSALTEKSLIDLLEQYSQTLKSRLSNGEHINACDLAWTLHSRRSLLPTRAAFSASTIEQLCVKIDAKLAVTRESGDTPVGVHAGTKLSKPRILGVFTGQGAQWAAMGAHLIRSSEYVRQRVKHLEESLATLPSADRPPWSLCQEMLAGNDTSRIAEAALSQPLCTALQIVLIDLLEQAGITFSAVVGHSSGEIAAAYAAGFFTAHDAIRIAYYRGLYARQAGSKTSESKGSMLAVGTSLEDAQQLVHLPAFQGRIAVAAYNSSASVTLSGDADAIVEAKTMLDEQKKFARVLKVDTAYHSHHMHPCGDPYIRALRACGVRVIRERNNACKWFSSVVSSPQSVVPTDELQDLYWRDNMAGTVLFADAVKNAISNDEQINLALEIGPHPALKGPAMQNIADVRPAAPILYTGVLNRGSNDVEAFADALGYTWTHMGSQSVDFASLGKAVAGDSQSYNLVLDLPSYRWNHGKIHWSESRRSKKIREREHLPHELLGVLSPDSNAHDMRWSNVLKSSEITWLDGHKLQGLAVFPASGYVSMAVEACRVLAGDKKVQLFELHQLVIPKAITFEEDDASGVEVLTTLTAIEHQEDQLIKADFSIYAASNDNAELEHDLSLVASGKVEVLLGDPDFAALPGVNAKEESGMTAVNPERIYASFAKLGYGYTGPFKGMSATKRKLNQAAALVDTYTYSDEESTFYLIHPSTLDVAIQSAMVAYSAPGDERLWSLHVPTSIRSITINPEVCASLPVSGSRIPISTNLIDFDSDPFKANIEIFSESGQQGMIIVEDLVLKPFAPATEAEDRWMYSSTELGAAVPEATFSAEQISTHFSPHESGYETDCERISYYYLRKWKSEITEDEWAACSEPHYRHLRDFADQTLSIASKGQHPTIMREWINDSYTDIQEMIRRYPNDAAIKHLHEVGENIPAAVRGQMTVLQPTDDGNPLRDHCIGLPGLREYHSLLGGILKQITFRYPHARIVEIGSGTGDATVSIYDAALHGGAMASYTWSDPSPAAVTRASETFKARDYSNHMAFKVLDIHEEITAQGYEPHSYDVVVASNVLHATDSLQKSLENVRRLLRPGGYLVLLELTNGDPIRFTCMMGNSPAWWLGVSDGRKYSPAMETGLWHQALRKSGFGGIDAITPKTTRPFSVMTAQAVDDKVLFLRRPLSSSAYQVSIESLVILGNKSLECARIAEEVSECLAPFCATVVILDGLPTAAEAQVLSPMSTFINLIDLESPLFKDMSNEKMEGLKRMFDLAKHILWLTRGVYHGEEPYHAASLAFCRSLTNEATHISINALDLSETEGSVSKVVAEQVLRQCVLEELDQESLLWSKEPETFLSRGKLWIPRILPNLDQNARLNTSRRLITKSVPASAPNLSVVPHLISSKLCLVEGISGHVEQNHNELQRIEVQASSLLALCTAPGAFYFLVMGRPEGAADLVIAATTTNTRISVPFALIPLPQTAGIDLERLLINVASELVATSLLETLDTGSSLLVHCSYEDRFFAAALSRQAAAKSVRVSFSCITNDSQGFDQSWIKLSPRSSRHVVRRNLASVQPTHFLDLTTNLRSNLDRAHEVPHNIANILPLECRIIKASDAFRLQASKPQLHALESTTQRLQNAVDGATASMKTDSEISGVNFQDLVLQLGQVESRSHSQHNMSVLNWRLNADIDAEVLPLSGPFFAKDKTYVLFGLSGQVGQSLCEWMISNGAGCVCLTSRRPNVHQGWLESFRGKGAIVKVLATDVTDMASLNSVLEEIRATCPPIAGVANGANVLSDSPFDGMSTDMMLQALRPKIDGSHNLDQAFYNEDLDFFVLFSSISCVIGTSGQSNYVAANGYLNGLVRQRRKRGLAASAFDIGLILGIGLAELAGQHVVDSLQKYGITPLSETDLRLAFAESIKIGHAKAADEEPRTIPAAVMTSGLRTITNNETGITWYNNPIFSHLIIDGQESDGSTDKAKGSRSTLSVKDQIIAATTGEAALKVMKECCAAKLQVILRSSDQEFDFDTPLVELGIDSLVAVEVRSWFLKSLNVDIPVLKLVGGSSLDEICHLAIKKLPADIAGQIGSVQLSSSALKQDVSTEWKASSLPTSSETAPSSSSSDRDHDASGQQTPPTITRQTSLLSLQSLRDAAKPSTTFVKREPISIGQSRFWFLRLLVQDPTAFNVTLSFRLGGHLRIGNLEKAIRVVTMRHESLRTSFAEDEGEVVDGFQDISAHASIRLERKTIASPDEVAVEYESLQAHRFNLGEGPLLRLVLLTLSPTSHYLLVNYHHIIMDMASFQVLTSELDQIYNGHSLGPPPKQYPDFSVAQRRALEQGEMHEELKYWREVFPTEEQPPILPLLPMARSKSRMAMTDYALHQVTIRLDPTLAAQVKSLSKAQRCTPFHFYLAVYKVMLFSFTDAQDLTIGIADANRNDIEVLGSIGFFLNLLALRFRREQGQTFTDAMVEARSVAYGALQHSRLPFDVLLQEFGVERSSSYSPFFQAFFDYRQRTNERRNWLNCQFDLEQMHPGRTAYDISLDVADLGSDPHITLRVQKGLYDATAAGLLLETYTHLVSTLSRDISLTLQDTPLFSEAQLARAVQRGVGPDMTSDWPGTLPQRIDQIAERQPNDIALMDGLGSTLTFAAMIMRVEAIAEALSASGAGHGSRVLVFQQAAVDWICSMLAIMRVGGVYVPLDLRNPMPRLATQAAHCQPVAVLADDTTISDAPQLNVTAIINISCVANVPSIRVQNRAQPDAAAAILYTSGSTGTPKGIMIRHRGMRNEMEGYTKTYKLGAERVLQQSAFTFDFSVDQMFTGLVNGGTVYVVPWSKRGDPLSITEIMRSQSITYTKVTPSEYSMWMQYGRENLIQASSWRFAFGGGEPFTKTVMRQFFDLGLEHLQVHNSYGPAEISIASHKGFIDYGHESLETAPGQDISMPCGYSLPNYATYILDQNLQPLPVGMPGEVVIGGAGVSLGYLNNDELTARVFVPNPYATPWYVSNGWTYMHRTGDVGYLREDGSLIFRNRIAGDTQVKLRGLRIDLQDVEANIIAASEGTLEAAVVTLRDGDPDFLVAHVVFSNSHSMDDRYGYLERLFSSLPIPQYMIPVLGIPLDELPLTNHSKVDRKAIKALSLPKRTKAIDDVGQDVTEMTETMSQLRQIWRKVLPNSKNLGISIKPSTSFFQIGGNSLLAVRLQSRVRSHFNVTIRLADFLNNNTLSEMARKIEESPNVGLIDWEEETMPPTIPSFLKDLPPKEDTGEMILLVTGVTGNLARHVFPLLSARPNVSKIHCVAVRDKPREQTPLNAPKVVSHVGDLSLPLLGLSVDEFCTLAGEVDAILHLGAVRSFWDNYHMLRRTNVHPTVELIKLASTRHIPIHFVSTSGVMLPEEIDNAAAASPVGKYEPPADGSEGYVATKWASERVLERSAAHPGLAVPSVVYRLLPSRSPGAQSEHAKAQVMAEFSRCIELTGAMPDAAGWEGRMDFIPAESVTRWMCDSVLESRAASSATADGGAVPGIQFLHKESLITVEVVELMAHVEAVKGEMEQKRRKPLEAVQLLAWMGRIKAAGFRYVLAAQDATVKGSAGTITSRR